ncbi:MAG TPA: DUF438 domain-containing protein [Candidatus Avimonas sp.]|jgi:DUF438 domain-containing protein|nr:DUF438 domain-containing protein [Clostridiales bacterium]HOB36191.1 DUF438 domain-containing protein [Candidatus Avimonas sp.]HQA15578.1 DUF438 domain-containing protein [Candidatus Avimonas sp.]HQD37608.1 DUF438 domain-containing protein [Candidatus Avimonas sp.]
MSEQINNRQYRQQVLKNIISQLHQGKTVEEVKQQFEEAFGGVSATEISEAEQALIAEGLPVSEVQRLCDVHAAVFKGSIEEIHAAEDKSQIPGHPANIMKRENLIIEEIIDTKISPLLKKPPQEINTGELLSALEQLRQVDIHYLKKENLIFPYMERYGITGPPKVMWGVDDEIRAAIKEAISHLSERREITADYIEKVAAAVNSVKEMIYKEENILLPMLMETLTQDEWKRISDESAQFGFLIDDVPKWAPEKQQQAKPVQAEPQESHAGFITLPTGVLKVEEIARILDTLPFDITFVDKNDIVKYFSQGKDRIFHRTKAVIGRNVANCHPPASVNIVRKIVEDFKSGAKEHEDFWIKMGERYVFIRYFAVRSETGEYLGVLEVTQDIKPIQEITGEKRLVSD